MVALGQVLQGQQEGGVLDGFQHLSGAQLIPRGGDDAGLGVVLPEQLHGPGDLVLGGHLGAAEDDGLGGFDLIDEEFAEIAGVHPALAHVGHGGAAGELDLMGFGHVVHHAADVAELAHAGGLDQYAIGVVFVDQLAQRLGEIAHQGAADAAGVELGDLDAGILHEAAVDAHLAVFIFQQDDLFAIKGAVQQLFDQRGLARAEETGDDVDLCHRFSPVFISYSSCDVAWQYVPWILYRIV